MKILGNLMYEIQYLLNIDAVRKSMAQPPIGYEILQRR